MHISHMNSCPGRAAAPHAAVDCVCRRGRKEAVVDGEARKELTLT